MKLSERVEWALHCTWTLAAAPTAGPLSTRRLAEFYDLPAPYLAKVLNSLVRAGVLTATSGPRGGFRLAKPATEITAAEVLEAVEGRSQLFSCTEIRQRGPVPLTGSSLPYAVRDRSAHGPSRAGLAERTGRNHHRGLGRIIGSRRT